MPKRSEAYRLDKKREILAAAKRVALQKGFSLTSLRDIAQEVGMSMGSIANYFAKKQEIIVFAAEQARAARAKDIEAIRDAPNSQEQFLVWVSAALQSPSFAEEAVLDLELVAESFRSDEVKSVVQGNADDLGRALSQLVQDADSLEALERGRLLLALYYGLAALNLLDIKPDEKASLHAFQTLLGFEGL